MDEWIARSCFIDPVWEAAWDQDEGRSILFDFNLDFLQLFPLFRKKSKKKKQFQCENYYKII